MDPAKPPFPTPMHLPFQFFVGSQSSILIMESAVGFRTITTRQCSGMLAGGWAGAAAPPPRAPAPRWPPAAGGAAASAAGGSAGAAAPACGVCGAPAPPPRPAPPRPPPPPPRGAGGPSGTTDALMIAALEIFSVASFSQG